MTPFHFKSPPVFLETQGRAQQDIFNCHSNILQNLNCSFCFGQPYGDQKEVFHKLMKAKLGNFWGMCQNFKDLSFHKRVCCGALSASCHFHGPSCPVKSISLLMNPEVPRGSSYIHFRGQFKPFANLCSIGVAQMHYQLLAFHSMMQGTGSVSLILYLILKIGSNII